MGLNACSGRVMKAFVVYLSVLALLIGFLSYLWMPEGGLSSRTGGADDGFENSPSVEEATSHGFDEELAKAERSQPMPDAASSTKKNLVDPGGREVVKNLAMQGRVMSANGEPLLGADVSWTAWDPAYLVYVTAAVNIPYGLLQERSLVTRTDGEGRFSFESTPPFVPGEPSILWVTHSGHEAMVKELDASVRMPADQQGFRMEAAKTVTVVVHNKDLPVPGCTVIQQAAFPRGSKAQYSGGEFAPKARLVFHRLYRSGEGGSVLVAPTGHKHYLESRQGGLLSSPWEGDDQSIIHLQLFPTFELSGFLEFPSEMDDVWGQPRIQVLQNRGSLKEELASIPVTATGDFGPAAVPATGAEVFTARLEGSDFISTVVEFDNPGVGGNAFVEFTAKSGFSKWFQALDSNGEPVPFPELVARWTWSGETVESKVIGREDGYVMVPGIPPGALTGTLTAPGMGQHYYGPVSIPEDPPSVLQCVLSPGYQLQGRCLRGIEPITDFEVRYWSVRNTAWRGSEVFKDTVDGEFTLDHLTTSRVEVMAISPDYGRSQPVVIDLTKDPHKDLVLDIAAPKTMHGVVVSSRSGEALPNATVSVFSSRMYTEMDTIGAPAAVGPAGHFELQRLAAGINVVGFHAPGFSHRELKVFATESGDVDLGEIELVPCQALTAKLILPDGHDPSQWMLTAKGIGAIRPVGFNGSGELRVENASEGAWSFEVRDLEGLGTILATQDRWLRAGEEWHLEFDLANGRSLIIKGPDVSEYKGSTTVKASVRYIGIDGRSQSQIVTLDKHGEARIHAAVAPGAVIVQTLGAVSMDRATGFAMYEVDESDPDEILIELPLELASRTMRIVDSGGYPLHGVAAVLRSSSYPEIQLAHGFTDSDGEVMFGSEINMADLVDLTSPKGGIHHGIELTLPSSASDVVEIEFEMSSSVEVLLTDGGTPQSTPTVRLWATDSGAILSSGQTPDGEGRVSFPNLCPGEYELRVDGPDHWPVRRVVEAVSHPSPRIIEVRRVGDLDLEFVKAGQGPLANQPLALECLTLGERALDWIASGKLMGFASGLMTDHDGKLILSRLPHGEYRWSAAGSSGSFRLEPGEVHTARLTVH